MPLMEVHFNPIRNDAGEVVGETVWMPAKPPKVQTFGKNLVDRYIERGAMRFDGEPVTLSLEPDPNGPMAGASAISMTYPGDKIVLTAIVGENTSPTDFTYRLTHYPIPQNWRHVDTRQRANDESEVQGIRIAPEYHGELVS